MSQNTMVSAFFRYRLLLFTTIILMIASSLFTSLLGGATYLAGAFDALILSLIAFALCKQHKNAIRNTRYAWFIIPFCYSSISGLYVYTTDGPAFSDFLIIYKCFIYLSLCALLAGVKIFPENNELIPTLTKTLIAGFAFFYVMEKLLFSIERPTVFYENNYEICAISILFYASFRNRLSQNILWVATFVLVVTLSSSRSGAASAFIAIISCIQMKHRGDLFIGLLFLLIFFIATMYSVAMRPDVQGGAEIDRLRFFDLFLYEVRNWNILNYLLGSPRITAVSTGTCVELIFYSELISDPNKGLCYSVIFHSFWIRSLFDHGALGICIVLFGFYSIFRRSQFEPSGALKMVLIISANGFSVSAFNSSVIMFSMVLIIMFLRPQLVSPTSRVMK